MKNANFDKRNFGLKMFRVGFLSIVLVLLALAGNAYNVTVRTSAGVGIPSVTVCYNNDGGGTWGVTTTDGNGVATISGENYWVKVNYNLSSTGWVNNSQETDMAFYTTAVTARVISCTTNAVNPNATFRFNPGTTLSGTWLTGSTQELFAGTWCIGADIYGQVRNVQTPTLGGNNTTSGLSTTITFSTTKVIIGCASGIVYCDPSITGAYNYYRNSFTAASGIELLPGTYYFMINGTSANYLYSGVVGVSRDISGCSLALPFTVTVKTSTGTPIPSLTVSYNSNGGGTWSNTTTNANGIATIPGGNCYVKVNYNLSSTGWVNAHGADITFYTTAVTARVVNCNGGGISGAYIKYNPGSSPAGTWISGNVDGSGSNTQELFAGTWYLSANYYGMAENHQTIVVAGNNTASGQTSTTTFTTTKVTIPGATGTAYCDPSAQGLYNYFRLSFTPATGIELLPGTYYFIINGASSNYLNCGVTPISAAVSGCTMILKTVTIRLVDSHGNGLANGYADYDNGAGHTNIGATNASGYVDMFFTTTSPSVFRLSYRQGGAGVGGYGIKTWTGVNVANNPVLIATTTNVTTNLYDHASARLAGGNAQYDAGSGWQNMGATTTTGTNPNIELLPGTYGFRVFYGGPNQSHNSVAVGTTALIQNFYTTKVTMNLWGGTSGNYISGGTATYDNGAGWQSGGTTTTSESTNPSIEILSPSSWTYAFRMAYSGQSTQTLSPSITTSPGTQDVTFTFSSLRLEANGTTGTGAIEFGIYPNPTKDLTSIQFVATSDAAATIDVYSITGSHIASIFNNNVASGTEYKVNFDASTLSPGVYLMRLNIGNESTVSKLVIMKN